MNYYALQKFTLSLFIVILSFQTSSAQLKDTDKYLSIGVSLGTAHYFGDLSPKDNAFSTDLSLLEPSLGIHLEKRMNTRLSTSFGLQWVRLLGDDNNADIGSLNYNRNLHFRNDLIELSAIGKLDLLSSHGHFSERRIFTPFLFGGVAAIHHNPRGKTTPTEGGIWIPLQPLKTEAQTKKYKLLGWAIPVGLGFQFRATEKIDISFEAGYRFTYTDFLDDVSGSYPDVAAFEENNLARSFSDRSMENVAARTGDSRQIPTMGSAAGSVRGDSRSSDGYLVAGFKVKYILSKNEKKDNLSRLHNINTPIEEYKEENSSPDTTFLRFKNRYEIEHLAINSEYSEMSPRFYQGGLVYISDRRDHKNFEKQARSGFYNFFYSPIHDLFKNELTKPIFLKDKRFLKYHHFAADYIPSKQKIILSMYEKLDNSAEVKTRKLYIADVIGENVWNNIQPLPFNSDNSSITQCSVSKDGNTLYFVSDREGGFGGTDIYVSYLHNGQWTYPINVGKPVNTAGNEMFPFIHKDNHLYFASDGHKGMGGLDMFESVVGGDGNIRKVKNLGAPINSEKDDFGLVLDDVKRHGYFTSNREGGNGGNDIYKLDVLQIAPSRELTDDIEKLFSVREMKLDGILVNKETNEPIPSAIVKLYDKLEDELLLTRSDNFGRFSFDIHNDAIYEIGSTIRGFKRMLNKEVSTIGMNKKEVFQYKLELEPIPYRFKVKGKVLNSVTKKPIAGAEVVLMNLYDDQYEDVMTNEDGSYTFDLKKDHNYVLFMLERGYKPWELDITTFNKRASETKVITIELNPNDDSENE